MGEILDINKRQIENLQAKFEDAKTRREVIELAITDLEARPCRNVEFCAGYAHGVIATYLTTGAISFDEFEVATARLTVAHRAAIQVELLPSPT